VAGGRSIALPRPGGLHHVFARIEDELGTQHSITCRPLARGNKLFGRYDIFSRDARKRADLYELQAQHE